MSAAEGPATVTLTDDEDHALRNAFERDVWAHEFNSLPAAVERIVAARVGALTADLAAAHAELDTLRARRGGEMAGPVCTDPACTIPRRPGFPMHGPHDFRAARPAAPTGENS